MKQLEFMDEVELKTFMTNLATTIEFVAEKMEVERPHFVLLVFNDPKVAQYIGNCQRSAIVEALRETANRLEKKEDIPR